MTKEEMKKRTKKFALDAIRLVDMLPNTRSADVLGKQALRSATSVGANYRAACRARSGAEFIAKLGIVEEEADETQYWLELLQESGMAKSALVTDLLREASELTAITVASLKTARQSVRYPTHRPSAPNIEVRTPRAKYAAKKRAIRNPKSQIRNLRSSTCE